MKSILKKLLPLIWSLLFVSQIFAQTGNCIADIKEASKNYDQGNYDMAIRQLKAIIDRCNLNKEDKISVNKLLILNYFAIDNLEAADKVASEILRINPNYKPDKLKDDVKLSSLFEKFKPIPSMTLGISLREPNPVLKIIKTYSVLYSDNDPNLGTYKSKTGFHLDAFFDYKTIKNLWLEAGFQYRNSGFEHTLNGIENTSIIYSEKRSSFDIPVSAKYYFLKSDLKPFIQAGAQFSFLNSSLSTTTRDDQKDLIDRIALRNTFSFGYFGAAGASYKIKNIRMFANIKYVLFPKQVNKDGTRYADSTNLYKYYYIDDDFSMNDIQVNIGASYILSYRIK